jgi:hypothetical protein
MCRYHSLMRDYVDEEDYPASQEYFLYADSQVKTTFEHVTLLL